MKKQRKVVVHGPEDGVKFFAGGDLYHFLATSSDTDGCYALWEAKAPIAKAAPVFGIEIFH
ncbi:MAG: hypothetical protein AAF802_15600 [Planctomycetota bacterium]